MLYVAAEADFFSISVLVNVMMKNFYEDMKVYSKYL
jgi:hypothetical protein